ncbi:MAG: hypothetical protein KF861_11485, partial [Planctomycetaceae bacterium]|nr:hypothetical protein [Planctomycetaceae bacterium]
MLRLTSPSELRLTRAEDDTFRSTRRLAALLIAIQAVILGYASGAHLFAGLTIGLAAIAAFTRRRLQIDRGGLLILYAAIALVLLLEALVSPFPFSEDALFVRTPFAHTVARYLICVQLVSLVVRRPSDRPPIWLAGLGALSLPFAANINLPDARHYVMLTWIMGFVAVAAVYGSHARRPVETSNLSRSPLRASLLAGSLLAALLLGGGGSLALLRYERDIEFFLQEFLGQGAGSTRSGFSPNGRLSDVLTWKTTDADDVALRVYSDRQPGYLRGMAFDTYL